MLCSTGRFRDIGLFLFSIGIAAAQETADGSFDFRATEPILDWISGVGYVLAGLACFGAWKLLLWLLEKNRTRINWSKVRLIWPTSMLVWGLVISALQLAAIQGTAFTVLFAPFELLNLPELIVIRLLSQWIDTPDWMRLLLGGLVVWAGNYALVRWAEWRAWARVPAKLDLADF